MFALSGCTVEQRCRDSRDCVDTQTCVVQAGIGSCRARTPTTAPGDAAAQATIDGAAPDNAPEDADRGDAPHVDVAPDSGVPQESGLLDDSTSADGGPDASLDAGERSEVGGDAGTLEETGSPRDPDAPDADAGVVETGAPDAGEPTRLDAGDPDAGLGQDAHDDGDGAPDAGGAPPQAEPEPVRAAQPRAIPALEPMALRPARGRTFKMTGGLISTRPAPRMTGGAYTLGSSITTTTQGTP